MVRNDAGVEAALDAPIRAVTIQRTVIPRGRAAAKVAEVVPRPAGTVRLARLFAPERVCSSKVYCAPLPLKLRPLRTVKVGVSLVACEPSVGVTGVGPAGRGGSSSEVRPPREPPPQPVWRNRTRGSTATRMPGRAARRIVVLAVMRRAKDAMKAWEATAGRRSRHATVRSAAWSIHGRSSARLPTWARRRHF